MVRQFSLRGTLMVFVPTRSTVAWFMRWLGFSDAPGEADAQPGLNLMYLGLKHFRLPPETMRVLPTVVSDDDLRALHVPVLLLIYERERIFDPAAALARARRLVPNFRGELVPSSSHEMCVSQRRLVDAQIVEFLGEAPRQASRLAGV